MSLVSAEPVGRAGVDNQAIDSEKVSPAVIIKEARQSV